MKMEIKLKVENMTCASCVAVIEHELGKAEGIVSANVNLATENVHIEYDSDKINEDQIIETIKKAGYKASNQSGGDEHSAHQHEMESDHHDHQKIESQKTVNMARDRFIATLVFGLPVLYLTMGKMIGLPMPDISQRADILIQFVLSTGAIISAINIWTSGAKSLIRLRPNMDALIFVGTATAYFYSLAISFPAIIGANISSELYFESAALILVFISLGKYLEALTRGKTSESIKKLMGLQPKTATVLRQIRNSKSETLNKSQIQNSKIYAENYEEIEVPINEVKVGDIVLVKPGGKIPTDGVVVEGYSGVDEKAITGESIPVEKKKGDTAIGATINKTGVLKIKATKVGADTMLSQIIKIVENALASKAPIQLLADKVAFYFVPAILVLAVVVMIIWLLAGQPFAFALTILVSILIITCPCAVGLATPTAVMMGTGLAAQNGILIKNGKALEMARKITMVVFDKTGTLTKGEPAVTEILSVTEILNSKSETLNKSKTQNSKLEKEAILSLAASVEKNSEHPLAESIVKKAKEEKIDFLKVDNFEAIPGHGVTGETKGLKVLIGTRKLMAENKIEIEKDLENKIEQLENDGKTVMIVADGKEILGLIAVADTLKDHSQEAVDSLHKLGKKVAILTGDNKRVGQAIAKKLGIDDVAAEVLPQEKASAIKQFQEKGYLVGVVGDGINDAPALATADLGIALGSGTDVAVETGDVVLVKDDLRDVVTAIDVSRYTISKIKQNLFWAFIYNMLGIPIAAGILYPATGWLLNPAIAALAMAFSSVSVVSNSALMRIYKPPISSL